ncbi:hypothetical protein FOZ63_011974, partial [Perkinsus olseni]
NGSGYRQRTPPLLDSAKVITIAEARKRISDRWTVLHAPRNPPSSAVNCIPAVEEGTADGQESSAAKLSHPHPGGKSMAIALSGSEDVRGGGGTTTDGAGDLSDRASIFGCRVICRCVAQSLPLPDAPLLGGWRGPWAS